MPYDPYPHTTPEQAVVGGLQAFSDNVNKLAMQHSIQSAQTQIDAINDSVEDQFKRHQAYRQVGQQLAFQLAGAGADAAHINALVGAIPKAPALPQNPLEGMTSEDPAVREATGKFLEQQHKQEIARIQSTGEYKLAAASVNAATGQRKADEKAKADDLKAFNANVTGFSKPKEVASLLEGRDAIESAQQQLGQASRNPAAFVAAAIGALRGTGLNRITELELKKMGDSLGLVKKFANMSAESIGHVAPNDIAAVQKVLDVMQETNRNQLRTKAERYAATVGSAPGSKHSPQDYYMQLRTKHLSSEEPMPSFDSSGRFSTTAQAPAPGAAPAAPAQPQGAYGIPGFTLR